MTASYQTRTPEQCRADARATVAGLLLRALARCGLTARAMWAHAIGISREYIDRCVAGEKQIHAADLLHAPEPVRLDFAQALIGEGRAVVDLPVGLSARDDLALVIRAQKETTEAINAHLAALADGRMDAAEGASLEAECDEGIAALLAIRERARLAQRERVIGLTGLRAVGGGR